jgi:molybdopterin converting factor subunit 1
MMSRKRPADSPATAPEQEREVWVRLFARARDLAGAERVRVLLPAGSTVGDLRRQLARQLPALAAFVDRCAVALDDEFAADTRPVPEHAEAALLPPVSGG